MELLPPSEIEERNCPTVAFRCAGTPDSHHSTDVRYQFTVELTFATILRGLAAIPPDSLADAIGEILAAHPNGGVAASQLVKATNAVTSGVVSNLEKQLN